MSKQRVDNPHYRQVFRSFFEITFSQLFSVLLSQHLEAGRVLHNQIAKLIFEIFLVLPERHPHRVGISQTWLNTQPDFFLYEVNRW